VQVTNRFHNTLFSFSSFWLVRIVNWKLAKDETIYQGGSVLEICKREGKKKIHINTEIKKKASKGVCRNKREGHICMQYSVLHCLYPVSCKCASGLSCRVSIASHPCGSKLCYFLVFCFSSIKKRKQNKKRACA
jgi:hypothetical protein